MNRAEEHLNERRAQNYRSTRLWHPDPNKVGMVGERTVAEFFGGEPDLRNRPGGDNGIDIEVLLNLQGGPDWIECDGKGSSFGDWLRVGVEIIKPRTVYILVLVTGNEGKCMGWHWGARLMEEKPINWCGNGTWVHALKQLQPMQNLLDDYLNQWRHHGLKAHPAKWPEEPKGTVNPFFGNCACGKPGLYVTLEGRVTSGKQVTTGKPVWFCQEHKPDVWPVGK